jgi:hypothetical protein
MFLAIGLLARSALVGIPNSVPEILFIDCSRRILQAFGATCISTKYIFISASNCRGLICNESLEVNYLLRDNGRLTAMTVEIPEVQHFIAGMYVERNLTTHCEIPSSSGRKRQCENRKDTERSWSPQIVVFSCLTSSD